MEAARKRSLASTFASNAIARPRGTQDGRVPQCEAAAQGAAWGSEMFYCCDCFALCGFEDIIMDGSHKSHNYIYAMEQARIVRDEVARQASSAQAAMPEFLSRMARVKKRMAEVEDVMQKHEDRIIERFDTMIRKLNERRHSLLTTLHEKKASKLRELEDLSTTMQVAFERATHAMDELGELSRELDGIPPHTMSPFMKSLQERVEAKPLPTTQRSFRAHAPHTDKLGFATMPNMLRHKKEGKRPPPPLSQVMLQYVRSYLPLTQSMSLIQTGATEMPELDKVEVFFRDALAADIDKYGKLLVHEGGFRAPSRSNYGGISLPYLTGSDKGLVWWLGTRAMQSEFRNPCQAGMMKIKCSTLFDAGQPGLLAGREAVHCLTKNQKQVSIDISAGLKMTFVLTHIVIRHGSDRDSHAIRNFVVEGLQNDTDEGVCLLRVENNNDLGTDPFKATVLTVSPPCSVAFKTIRIRMAGVNNNTDPSQSWKMCICGVELFGTLYSST